MQEQRLTLRQKRETIELAGWLALLVGCLEYDLCDRRAAGATRRAALNLGIEAGSSGIVGWAHEMRAWFALTGGDYRGVIAAAEAGQAAAGRHSVAVQLIAQEAKAYARMGKSAEMRDALERGRVLLDSMPYPDNVHVGKHSEYRHPHLVAADGMAQSGGLVPRGARTRMRRREEFPVSYGESCPEKGLEHAAGPPLLHKMQVFL